MRSTGMSPVVEAWSTCRTSSAQDWPPDRLLQAKGQTTVSVVMPARDEEATVGTIGVCPAILGRGVLPAETET